MFFFKFLLLLFAISSSLAHADTLTAVGGLSAGRNSGVNEIKNPSPLLGLNYGFGLNSHLEVGGFFDQNFLGFADGGTGSLRFMGALVRYSLSDLSKSGFYLQAKVGLSQASEGPTTNSQIAVGAGGGYRIILSKMFSISPQVEGKFLQSDPTNPNSSTTMIDATIALSLHF